MAAGPAEQFSPALHRFFHFMFARRTRRAMRAVRIARWGLPPEGLDGAPTVVFANHPSWWDGVAFMLLPAAFFPHRLSCYPMDAEALARYGFMRRLGVFGVTQGSPRGAVEFLRQAKAVLAEPTHMLWMNAPGRFQDVRERPVVITPGLAALVDHAPTARFVPLALEYPFWGEARPEFLAAFGPALEGAALAVMPREARTEALREALTATMDRLAEDALARDPERFQMLTQGDEGMGGIYQVWQRLKAAARGERFDPRHERR